MIASCQTYKVQTRPLPDVLASSPTVVRVRLSDHRVIDLYRPRLEGDSVIGLRRPPNEPGADRIAIATADIAQVSASEADAMTTVKTGGAIIGIVLVGLFFLLVYQFKSLTG